MEQKFGVFVGRFSPLHIGHEVVIKGMIDSFGIENCLVILGSSNAPISFRHLFSYEDRRRFIKEVFGDIAIVGLPDYPTNEEWLLALDDILDLRKIDKKEVVFFGGCEEDIYFFLEHKRPCKLFNRFDGETPKISATEVRDALIRERSLDDLLNPKICEIVKVSFTLKWEKLKKL